MSSSDRETRELERLLLRSFSEDRMPPRLTERVLAGLGAGGAILGAAQASAAVAATKAGPTTATASAAAAGAGVTTGLTKALVAGLVAGTVTMAGVTLVSRMMDDESAKTVPSASGFATAHSAPLGVGPDAGARAPVESLETLPESVVPPPAPVPDSNPSSSGARSPSRTAPPAAPSRAESAPVTPSPAVPPSAAPASTLAREIRVLERARAALASGDARAALRALDEHRSAFPTPNLGPEAAVLEIEALVQGGQRDRALLRAHEFHARFPRSSHRERVDLLVGAHEGAEKSTR
jgi:hypothetical protein